MISDNSIFGQFTFPCPRPLPSSSSVKPSPTTAITALDRQISATDTQIDRLIYDLYGLTEEEIKLVEGA